MTPKNRIQVRQSEVRQELNTLLQDPEADASKMDTLANELKTLEIQLRAALELEEAETRSAEPSAGSEGAEFRGLVQRVELRDYLAEAAKGSPATGAALELREHVFGASAREGLIPFQALLPTHEEHRVDVATAAPATGVETNQRGILARVMAASATMFLGVSDETTAPGEASFPVLTSGAAGGVVAAGAEQGGEAATFNISLLAPARASARYVFRLEDLARLTGMEDSLRMDLRQVLTDLLDKQVLRGSGVAPESSGFVTELPAPTGNAMAGAAVASFGDLLQAELTAVDGKFSDSLGQVRFLMAPASYRIAGSVFNTAGDVASAAYLNTYSGGVRVSANLPAAAANLEQAILYKTGGEGSAVLVTWGGGFELIRDPYQRAAFGEVALTANVLHAFKVLREDAYARASIRIAV